MMMEIALERAAAVLASDALKSSLILSVAGLTVAIWRGASASSRHLVWTAAVAATIAVPIAGFLLPAWLSSELAIRESTSATPAALASATIAPVAPAPDYADAHSSPAPHARQSMTITTPTELPSASETILAPPSRPQARVEAGSLDALFAVGWARLVIALWLIGLLLALIPLLIGRLRLGRIAASARPVTDGRWIDILERMRAPGTTARRVTLLESHDAAMPMTWGVVSPVLLIPARTESWPEWKCRDILLHELAHIERFDCLTQMIAGLACAVYWFNPLVWVAAHRMRVEREVACDDRVLNNGSRPSEYATHLLDVALSLRAPRATAQAAIAMARPSQLKGRLTAVLDRGRNRRKASPRFRVSVAAATLGVLLPVASFSPFVTEATAAHSPPTSRGPVSGVVGLAGEHAPRGNGPLAPDFGSAPPTAAPRASAAPGFVVATTSGATSSVVTTSSAAGYGFMIATTPVAASVKAMLYSVPQGASCWESSPASSSHNHNQISIDNDGSGMDHTTVTFSNGDCSLDIRAEGTFTLRPDLSDLASIERGGYFTIEERTGGSSRRMEIRPGSGGLDHVYYVDGRRADYSAEARAWLAQVLLATERHTAFAAKTRVPQIFEGRGANGVLDEVSLMQSDYAKAAYLNVLFKQGVNFDAPTLTRVVKQSSREMTSDYYLAEVFNLVGAQKFTDASTWRAFADAAGGIKSDYYKAQVIGKVLSRDNLDAATTATLLKAASTIDSDYYQAETLKAMSRKYGVPPENRAYYLAALGKIKSDYYRQEVLGMLGGAGAMDAPTAAAALRSATDMKSDYYKAETLMSIARRGNLDASARREFFAAIKSIDSDYYKHQVLNASLRERPLTRETVAEILAIAPSIKSDYELSALLTEVARNFTIDESLRPAYEKAANAIESEYYRDAALSAARRSANSR